MKTSWHLLQVSDTHWVRGCAMPDEASAGKLEVALSAPKSRNDLPGNRLMAMTVAVIALVNPLGPFVSVAEAGQASVTLHVSAYVIATTKLSTAFQESKLLVAANHIAQGHIDIPAASRFSVVTNHRAGYLIDLHPVGDIFQAVQVTGLAHGAQLSADGGTIVVRGPISNGAHQELSYRFILRPDATPGVYAWPLVMSVRSM